MKLSELIDHVGDDNIQVQGLGSSFVKANLTNRDAEITFATDREKGLALCGVAEPKYQGMIIWLPIDKLPS